MGYILMFPDNSSESLVVVKYLQSTSDFFFDRTSSTPRLIAVFFDYQSNFDQERD